jgi:hypothetical protein
MLQEAVVPYQVYWRTFLKKALQKCHFEGLLLQRPIDQTNFRPDLINNYH